ncbi:hypothetical protein PENTCL1PPCAC_17524, partial [Pristionchus entomophagus]
RFLLLSVLSTLVLTQETEQHTTPEPKDCLDGLLECYAKLGYNKENGKGMEIVTLSGRTEENVFHYCELTRTKVIPCLADTLNLKMGESVYEKGALLYNCPINKSPARKQVLQDEGKGFLVTCVYNDIRNLQHKECLEYIVDKCGMRGNSSMRECHAIDPCPPEGRGSTGNPYNKHLTHAEGGITNPGDEMAQSNEGNKGLRIAHAQRKSDGTTQSSSIPTLFTTLLTLLAAFLFK